MQNNDLSIELNSNKQDPVIPIPLLAIGGMSFPFNPLTPSHYRYYPHNNSNGHFFKRLNYPIQTPSYPIQTPSYYQHYYPYHRGYQSYYHRYYPQAMNYQPYQQQINYNTLIEKGTLGKREKRENLLLPSHLPSYSHSTNPNSINYSNSKGIHQLYNELKLINSQMKMIDRSKRKFESAEKEVKSKHKTNMLKEFKDDLRSEGDEPSKCRNKFCPETLTHRRGKHFCYNCYDYYLRKRGLRGRDSIIQSKEEEEFQQEKSFKRKNPSSNNDKSNNNGLQKRKRKTRWISVSQMHN